MLLDVGMLVGGLLLLVFGGDWLVRGAANLALRFGVSPLVIGLTVVAFGTSAPEMAVNVQAALAGKTEISFGNIIGSNFANIGLIIGISAMIKSLAIDASIIRREIPMMLLATLAVLAMSFDDYLDGTPNVITRSDGIVLLLLFCVFLYYTAFNALNRKDQDFSDLEEFADPNAKPMAISASGGLTLLGLVGVVGGGHFTVEGAVGVAEAFGVPHAIIGLTLIAIGTSLPELATGVMATYRGQTDIAVGNVVGSNIFNLLFILGPTAIIHDVAIPDGGWMDLAATTILSVLLLPMAMTGSRHIGRKEGSGLLIVYFCYMSWRFFG